jgi:hypothetical protein
MATKSSFPTGGLPNVTTLIFVDVFHFNDIDFENDDDGEVTCFDSDLDGCDFGFGDEKNRKVGEEDMISVSPERVALFLLLP